MVTFSMTSNVFDFININGSLDQASVGEVAFALRGMFPSLPSKQYQHNEVVQHLHGVISRAILEIQKIVPLLTVVHAQLALKESPRAVDFKDVCERISKLIDPFDRSVRNVSQMAVYMALAYHTLYFVRTHRSPFVAVSSQAMNAVNKVMNALTRVELDHGSAQLIDGRVTGVAKVLKDFLDHWALWNDQRVARAAEAVLEKCDGSMRKLDSPRALSSALNRLDNVRLFPWLSSHSFAHFTDSASTNLTEADATLKQGHPTPELVSSRVFSTNLLQECVLLDNTTAACLDNDGKTLCIFIPRIMEIPSILGVNSKIGIAARTIKLQNTIFPLLKASKIQKYAFRLGRQTSALRFSVNVDAKTSVWDMSSVRVDAAEIDIVTNRVSSQLDRVLTSVEPLISDHELQLPMPEENLASNSDLREPSVPQLGAIHAQSAAGRIAGVYMKENNVEAPFLVSVHGREMVNSGPGWHDRLEVDAYVPIGRPFDSSLALLAQRQLLKKPISPFLYNGTRRPSLTSKLRQTILPQLRLAAEFELRDLQFWTLRNLQLQLQSFATFHIFRCILLESSRPDAPSQGQLIRAFCSDLGIQVDVFVPPHTEQVFDGDQIIGTEILELDPLQGLFVVSM